MWYCALVYVHVMPPEPVSWMSDPVSPWRSTDWYSRLCWSMTHPVCVCKSVCLHVCKYMNTCVGIHPTCKHEPLAQRWSLFVPQDMYAYSVNNMISMYPHSTENVKPRNKQINKQTNKNTTQRTKIIFLFFYIFLLELQGWALRLIVDSGAEGELYIIHICWSYMFSAQLLLWWSNNNSREINAA